MEIRTPEDETTGRNAIVAKIGFRPLGKTCYPKETVYNEETEKNEEVPAKWEKVPSRLHQD